MYFPKSELKPCPGCSGSWIWTAMSLCWPQKDGRRGVCLMWLPQSGEGALLEYLVSSGKRNSGLERPFGPVRERTASSLGRWKGPDSADPVKTTPPRTGWGFISAMDSGCCTMKCSLFRVISLYLFRVRRPMTVRWNPSPKVSNAGLFSPAILTVYSASSCSR